MNENIIVRPAVVNDAEAISNLLACYAEKQIILPRTIDEIISHIDRFMIAYAPGSGVVGCVALRDFGNGLAEVRSLVVSDAFHGQGIGSKLVNAVIIRCRASGHKRLFALTYRTDFFIRLGFHQVTKDLFPEKIWSDCSVCPKKDRCDEDAVLIEIERPK